MQEFVMQLLSDYAIIAPVFFILIRSLAIIFPPIPGIAMDLPAIVVFGWFPGFVYAEIGVMLGAIVSFYIARKFREPLVGKFVFLQKLQKLEDKFSSDQKFWALVAIRIPTNAIFDYISYAAGLSSIGALRFFFASLIGSTPTIFATYYFGGFVLSKGIYFTIALVLVIIIGWIIFKKFTPKKA